jgi:sodium/potassium-transporting ATPase subunit alpha
MPLRNIGDYRFAAPKLFEIKFNSTNKWALSIHLPEGLQQGDKGQPLLLLKGAPEQVRAGAGWAGDELAVGHRLPAGRLRSVRA